MGCKLSKPSSSEQKPEAGQSFGCGCGSSIFEPLKPECLKGNKVPNRRQVHQEQKKGTKVSKLTLQEWLLTSPSLKAEHLKGGELCVLKHGSKRVHPSVSTRGRESFSKDRLLLLDHQVADIEDYSTVSSVTSFSRTQSGKPGKKVSFKLPEEADIIIFHSPQNSMESAQD
ncbi:unnamed protein product [Dovyalis caffra]|uniref:Uncharacterized protein n=1 Tax=Dovyalis caffra TaxID=77055 RepID=A0AAV1S4X6_9ROSI|nr:unnamed protein product [Dovyalis caffra]